MKKCKLAALVFISTVWISSPAYAYLDPGTGSMLIQAFIGAVTGVLVVGGVYWAKVKAFFARSQPENEEGGTNNSE